MYVLANMLLRQVRSSSDSLTKHPAGAPTKVGDHDARLLIVSKAYWLARAWKRKMIVEKVYQRAQLILSVRAPASFSPLHPPFPAFFRRLTALLSSPHQH